MADLRTSQNVQTASINWSVHINKRVLKMQDQDEVINEQEICLSSLESKLFLREKRN